MLDRLVAAGRDAAAVGALPYPLAARAQAHLRLGHLAQARADADEAVALAEQTRQDPALVIALGSLAMVDAIAGDADACRAAAERGLALGVRRGLPLPSVYAVYALDLLAAGLEARRRARARGGDPRRRAGRQRRLDPRPRRRPACAPAAASEAREWVEHYAALAAGKRAAPAVAERMRGLLADDPAAAEAHLRAAVALHAGVSGAARRRPHAARARPGAARRRPRGGGARAAARRAGRASSAPARGPGRTAPAASCAPPARSPATRSPRRAPRR